MPKEPAPAEAPGGGGNENDDDELRCPLILGRCAPRDIPLMEDVMPPKPGSVDEGDVGFADE